MSVAFVCENLLLLLLLIFWRSCECQCDCQTGQIGREQLFTGQRRRAPDQFSESARFWKWNETRFLSNRDRETIVVARCIVPLGQKTRSLSSGRAKHEIKWWNVFLFAARCPFFASSSSSSSVNRLLRKIAPKWNWYDNAANSKLRELFWKFKILFACKISILGLGCPTNRGYEITTSTIIDTGPLRKLRELQ